MFFIPPAGPANKYDTFAFRMPTATHSRPARCEEISRECLSMLDSGDPFIPPVQCPERHCGPWAHGWKTLLDLSIPQQLELAKLLIKNEGKRHWTSERNGNLVTFTFPSGQQCFESMTSSPRHRISLDRPAIPKWKNKHWSEPGRLITIGADEWMDRFGENQIRLKEIVERG